MHLAAGLLFVVSCELGVATHPAGASPAEMISCNTDGPNGTADPTALISAMENAPSGSTISLTPGCTYTISDINNDLQVPTGLPEVDTALTIDGEGATITRNGSSQTPPFVVLAVGLTGILTVNDVTVTNGYDPSGSSGGGIFNEGSLAVLNSSISNNLGSGIYNSNGATATISNSTISGNGSSGGEGGGIENTFGTLNVLNSDITDNTSNFGGGIANTGGTGLATEVAITDSVITNNVATYEGGGVFCSGSGGTSPTTCSISGSTISGNVANNHLELGGGPGAGGGGVSNYDAAMTLTDSTVAVNSTGLVDGDFTAGGIANVDGVLNILHSTIVENTNNGGYPNADIYNSGSGTIAASIFWVL
jgi:hypothetical protein